MPPIIAAVPATHQGLTDLDLSPDQDPLITAKGVVGHGVNNLRLGRVAVAAAEVGGARQRARRLGLGCWSRVETNGKVGLGLAGMTGGRTQNRHNLDTAEKVNGLVSPR